MEAVQRSCQGSVCEHRRKLPWKESQLLSEMPTGRFFLLLFYQPPVVHLSGQQVSTYPLTIFGHRHLPILATDFLFTPNASSVVPPLIIFTPSHLGKSSCSLLQVWSTLLYGRVPSVIFLPHRMAHKVLLSCNILHLGPLCYLQV